MKLVFKPTRLSIVIAVLNSHRVVKRQLTYFKRLRLPDDIEVILMDDGSDPPLSVLGRDSVKNVYMYPTGNKELWTQSCARNLGAKIAQGTYLFMTDIDHILPIEAIKAAYKFNGDKMQFRRSYAILNNNGHIIRDPEVLFKYGLRRERYKRRRLSTYYHVNTFVMRKEIYKAIDGYDPKCSRLGVHATHDDKHISGKYRRYCKVGKCKPAEWGPEVYVFPATGEDPKRLFHDLDRRTVRESRQGVKPGERA